VLVAGLPGTRLIVTIPSEYVVNLLKGRILRITPGQAIRSGAGAKMPIAASVADPMERIQKLSLDVWAGGPGKARPATDRPPAPATGDGPRVTCDLAFNRSDPVTPGESFRALGSVDLPTRGDGQVYWIQPRYVGPGGKERWGEATVLEYAGLPVDT